MQARATSRVLTSRLARRSAGTLAQQQRNGSAVRNAVLIDGCRTPFQTSGTGYKDLLAWQVARQAIQGLVVRNPALDLERVDRVVYGNVIQEVLTANVGREAALAAGVPRAVPANTVSMACISSNRATSDAVDAIKSGQADAAIVGGVETMSDVPIRFSRELRKRMIASTKMKKPAQYLQLFKGFKLGMLAPQLPPIAEFSTNEVMGHSADRLCATWGVSRADQDVYAARSHTSAFKASEAGLLTDRLALSEPSISTDNGVKGDSTVEKLSTLRPAFIKPHGTVTAGSSSFLTDGASAALVMNEQTALEQGHKPRAHLRDYVFTGMDPKEELLLGPAYSIAKLLKRNGLTVKDIDVWEIHEAFAGQVLANLNALESRDFCENKAGADLVGALPMDKINNWGGSLSLGHPFAATGVRLVSTAANRLIHEDGELSVVAACAAGGLGTAMLVQRYKHML